MTALSIIRKRMAGIGLNISILFMLCISMIFIACGCRATNITSEPPGAEVWLNGKYVGVTPIKDFKVTQEIGHMNKYRFKVFLEGYESITKTYYESPMMNVIEVIPSKIHFKMLPAKEKKTTDPEAETNDSP